MESISYIIGVFQVLFTMLVDNAPYVAGFVFPPIVDYLNRDVHSEKERAFVALVVCFVFAIFFKWNAIIYGTPHEFVVSLGVLYLESQVLFKFYFKDSSIRQWLKLMFPTRTQPLSEQIPLTPEEARQFAEFLTKLKSAK